MGYIATFLKLAVIVFTLISISTTAYSSSKAESLMNDCQQQRQAKLTPLREAEIKQCVSTKQGSKSECERYFKNYGEVTMIGGRPHLGKFYDLPVCQQALDAEKAAKNSGR